MQGQFHPKGIISMKGKQPRRHSIEKGPTRELIAYRIHRNQTAAIVPARRERKWMDDVLHQAPYRCLPLTMANQYGWEILSTNHVRVTWDGRSPPDGLSIETLYGDGGIQCHSHFGAGILTFNLPFLFKTPPGWNLMVHGPMNSPKDGLVALDGIVETDWAHATFTMNWRFTRACTVEFVVGEAVCLFFPLQRSAIDTFEPQIRALRSNPGLQKKHREWDVSRSGFIRSLKNGDRETVEQGWQKDYLKAAIEKKPHIRPT